MKNYYTNFGGKNHESKICIFNNCCVEVSIDAAKVFASSDILLYYFDNK